MANAWAGGGFPESWWWGQAHGFADPDAGLGFGYTPNQTLASGEGGDPRWPALIDAVYACL